MNPHPPQYPPNVPGPYPPHAPGPYPPPPAAPRSWLSRHWPWLLPIGCLGMLGVFGGAIFGFFALLMGAMRSSDVYSTALATAQRDPVVVTELGAPIEPGWFVSGHVQTSGSSGAAELTIPLSGPKASGTLYAVATKTAGKWTYSRLEVGLPSRPAPIDLLRTHASP